MFYFSFLYFLAKKRPNCRRGPDQCLEQVSNLKEVISLVSEIKENKDSFETDIHMVDAQEYEDESNKRKTRSGKIIGQNEKKESNCKDKGKKALK